MGGLRVRAIFLVGFRRCVAKDFAKMLNHAVDIRLAEFFDIFPLFEHLSKLLPGHFPDRNSELDGNASRCEFGYFVQGVCLTRSAEKTIPQGARVARELRYAQ